MFKTTKIFTTITTLAATSLLLAACGSKTNSSPSDKSSKTTTTKKAAASSSKSNKAWFAGRSKVVSQLFNTPDQHIWYYFDDVADRSDLTEDDDNDYVMSNVKLSYQEAPRFAMVIKKDYATTYELGDKSIGDLSQMNESEQMAYLKKSDKEMFAKDLAETTKGSDADYLMGITDAEVETYLNFLKQAKYQAPTPYKINAGLMVDSTGANVQSENVKLAEQVPFSNIPVKMAEEVKKSNDSGDYKATVAYPGLSLEATQKINESTTINQRPGIVLAADGYWGTQIIKSAAFGIISPAITRGEDRPFLATLVPYKTFIKNQDHVGVTKDTIGTKNTVTIDADE